MLMNINMCIYIYIYIHSFRIDKSIEKFGRVVKDLFDGYFIALVLSKTEAQG